MRLHFNMKGAEKSELTHGKNHAFTFKYARGSIIMASVICVHLVHL